MCRYRGRAGEGPGERPGEGLGKGPGDLDQGKLGANARRAGPVCAVMFLCSLLANEAAAQAPLSIEQLLMDARRLQVTAGLDHHGRSTSGLDEQIEQAVSAAVRYGLRSGLEFNARFTRAEIKRRLPGERQSTESESLALGLNWLLRAENAWPAVLLEARAPLWQTQDEQRRSWPGGSLAVTAYRSIDPVVLSLRAGYRHRRSTRLDGRSVRPGAAWSLEPMVSFAVNPRVTLIGAISVTREAVTQIAGRSLFAPQYRRELRAGLAYAPSRDSTVFLIGSLGDGLSSGGVSLQWFFEFR